MGIAERKEREKERRKNEIIDAAERIFFSKGIQNATMDDIAQEAELSKGTLYLYFESKLDLYLAISMRGLEILKELFSDSVAQASTGLDKIYAIGLAYLQFAREYPNYYNALMYYEYFETDFPEDHAGSQLCATEGHRVLDLVVEALHVGIEDGTVKSDIDPVLTANVLWAQTSGIIQFATDKRKHLEKKHGIIVQEFIDTYFEMIGNVLRKT